MKNGFSLRGGVIAVAVLLTAASIIPVGIDNYKQNSLSNKIAKTSYVNLSNIIKDFKKSSSIYSSFQNSSAAYASLCADGYVEVYIDGHFDHCAPEPTVLDLDGKNKYAVTDVENGMYFDFNGDGFAEKMAWAVDGDGVLAVDLNKNGKIDNGDELIKDTNFKSFDTDNDGSIHPDDKDFELFRILRKDGKITTLKDEKIEYISLKTHKEDYTDKAGNYLFAEGGFRKSDGKDYFFGEYYFAADMSDTLELNLKEVPKKIKALPDIKNKGTIHSLHQAMVDDKKLTKLVSKFVKEENESNREDLLENIILRLTNSDKLKDSSSQHKAVVNKLLGYTGDMDEVVIDENKNPETLENILKEKLYLQYKNYVYAELMSQSHLKEYVKLIKNKNNKYDLTALTSALDKKLKEDNNSGKELILEVTKMLKGLGLDKNSNYFDPKDDDCFYTKFTQNDRDFKWQIDIIAKTTFDVENAMVEKDELMGSRSDDVLNLEKTKINKKYKYIHSFEGDDVLYGNKEVNTFIGCDGNDMLDGGDGNDYMYGMDGDDIYFGGNGDDYFYTGKGNDIVIAGEGDDHIFANVEDEKLLPKSGDNIIKAGKGNDEIYSINGNDTYIFNIGDGQDIITDIGGNDTIFFGKGIKWNDLKFAKNGNNLVISFKTGNDTITIKDWFKQNKNSKLNNIIETFEFADGTKHTNKEVKL